MRLMTFNPGYLLLSGSRNLLLSIDTRPGGSLQPTYEVGFGEALNTKTKV